jgi:hypothetical protein
MGRWLREKHLLFIFSELSFFFLPYSFWCFIIFVGQHWSLRHPNVGLFAPSCLLPPFHVLAIFKPFRSIRLPLTLNQPCGTSRFVELMTWKVPGYMVDLGTERGSGVSRGCLV